MVDVVDKATRSRMMAGIRAKNTQPELYVRKGLHSQGFRFRLHVKDIPGRPDIVLPKFRALIVIQGCFWHAHNCSYFKLPATNAEFWRKKLEENLKRDRLNLESQLAAGWRCLIIWECAIRASQKEPKKLDIVALTANWLRGSSLLGEINEQGVKVIQKIR